jgi:UDP:flavonoid glycosyltransferase YjiC (YdhE family)
MARVLFLTWNGAGNQPPAVAVAQALRVRGHQITFAGYRNQQRYFEDRGFRFVQMGRSSDAWSDESQERMFDIKVNTAWASSHHIEDVPRLLAHERSDVIVVDCLMFGALASAERLHVPAVTLVHSAPGALMPPKGKFERLILDAVNAVRREAGLLAVASLYEAWERLPAMCNSIRELDPLAAGAPASLVYLGPLLEKVQPSGWMPPWAADDDRPLVLVSFSTGPYWDQTSRITRTLKALARENCRVLVTGAESLASADVPPNAAIVGHVPHDEVLPRTAVTVTHAGHGTVTASLRHGVPLICLPNPAADQPLLAQQVEAIGAGIALDGDNATAEDIRAAARCVLSQERYAETARMLAKVISSAPGVAAAADRLERVCSFP